MTEPLHIVCPHCAAINRLAVERDAKAGKCGKCGQPLFTGKAAPTSAARFDRQLAKSDIPLIVDFWAGWCGPCQAMAPVFDKAAAELEPRARFLKIDVDAEPAVAARYGVRGIPALFLFKAGKVAAGLADLALLRRWAGGEA